MKELLRYTHVFQMILVWAYAFLFVKPKRIKELWPVGLLSLILMLVSDIFLISLGLFQYNKPLIKIFGAPLFHLIWAAGSGIIYIHYSKPSFGKQLLIILLFTIATLAFDYTAQLAGVAQKLNNYTFIHSAFLDFSALIALLWVSEGLLGNRVYSVKNRRTK